MIAGVVARHPLGRLRPTTRTNAHGRDDETYPAPADAVAVGRWAIDAGDTTEDAVNRSGTEVTYTARGPFAADVRPGDRIVYAGDVYRIVGGILRQQGTSAVTSHTIIRLSRWEDR